MDSFIIYLTQGMRKYLDKFKQVTFSGNWLQETFWNFEKYFGKTKIQNE